MIEPIRLLVTWESEREARAIEQMLASQGQPFQFSWERRLEVGLTRLDQADIALVDIDAVTDIELEGLKRAMRDGNGTPVLVLSEDDEAEIARLCLEAGAQACLGKARMSSDRLAHAIAFSLYRSAKVQLAHSDRLASIGQLAAGVAHEINNPAAFIETNSSVLIDDVEALTHTLFELRAEMTGASGEEAGAVLDGFFVENQVAAKLARMAEICSDNLDGIKRIAATVRDLSAFARIDRHDVEVASVIDIIRTACSMVRNQIRHHGELIIDTKPQPLVAVDRARLVQVFVNLLVNAAHALDESKPEKNFIRVAAWAECGELVITVEDNGCGIREADVGRLFEPFFTTKPRDRGTGLGLALAAETVRAHGGQITVESQLDVGTTFRVVIPADTGLVPTSGLSRGRRTSVLTRKPCRILVVDDEPLLRRAYERVLSPPHSIVHAADGAEGLAILAANPSFDVIVCDLMMPGLDGPGFYAGVLELLPRACKRIIFVSGGAFSDRCVDFLERVDPLVLEKPLSSEVLLAIVDRVAHEAGPLKTPA